MKTLINVLVLATTLLSVNSLSGSESELEADIARAAQVEDSVKRLAAYDAAAKKHGLVRETSVRLTESAWSVSESVSPIDDSMTVVLSCDAVNPVKSGYDTETPTLIVREAEGELSVYIHFGFYLGMDETEVTWRIDKRDAVEKKGSISTSSKAVFFRPAWPTLAKLMDANTLVVRITPYGENPVTTEFRVAGLKEALAPHDFIRHEEAWNAEHAEFKKKMAELDEEIRKIREKRGE